MQNENINDLNILEKTFLYTAYTDDTLLFLKDEKYAIELMKTFDIFSTFSGLKADKSKCEIAGFATLIGVKLALCAMESIDPMFNAITAFKTLAMSKIVQLALLNLIPISIIFELNKIKKHFIWKNCNPKIKQDSLCKYYENVGLKNVDITFKIISLQCSWVKRLYDNSADDWKLIRLHIITQKLGKHFLFHFKLDIDPKKRNIIKKYYQNAAIIQYRLGLHLL